MQNQSYLVKSIEAGYTVSGLVFSTLQCSSGLLGKDLILSDRNGQAWKIVDNNFENVIKLNIKIKKQMKTDKLYMYLLEPIAHLAKPAIGIMLEVNKPVI